MRLACVSVSSVSWYRLQQACLEDCLKGGREEVEKAALIAAGSVLDCILHCCSCARGVCLRQQEHVCCRSLLDVV